MNIQTLRIFILWNRQHTAEYIAGEGALCPACVRFRLNPARAPVYCTDGLVRYHVCPLCHQRFKSVERVMVERFAPAGVAAGPGKLPEIVDAKPRKKQNRVKKR